MHVTLQEHMFTISTRRSRGLSWMYRRLQLPVNYPFSNLKFCFSAWSSGALLPDNLGCAIRYRDGLILLVWPDTLVDSCFVCALKLASYTSSLAFNETDYHTWSIISKYNVLAVMRLLSLWYRICYDLISPSLNNHTWISQECTMWSYIVWQWQS